MTDVKLWNKGKAIIFGHHSDIIDPTTGKNKTYAFAPETAQAFSENDANKLRRLYKKIIVSMDDIQRQFDEKPVANAVSADVNVTHISIDEAERQKNEAVQLAVAAEKARIADELRKFGLHDGAEKLAGEVEAEKADIQTAAPGGTGVADAAPAAQAPAVKGLSGFMKGIKTK